MTERARGYRVGRGEPEAAQARRAVASFSSYRDAERAVDLLFDRRFPVERVAIVGRELHTVEQVTGRIGYGRAALGGAAQGAAARPAVRLTVRLVRLDRPAGDQSDAGHLRAGLGAVVGALLGLLHAMSGGRWDFASVGGSGPPATTR